MTEEEKKTLPDRLENPKTWKEAGMQALEEMDRLNKEVQTWKSKYFSLEEVVKRQSSEIEKLRQV
jgi:hypothetical protein